MVSHLSVLGLEHEFQQKLLPDGRISIDGFICIFDVSDVAQRPMSKQAEYVSLILAQLAKTKKPIVLATTKNDELVRPHALEAEHLLTRKELRGAGPIPVVETSANLNINVDHAFMTLAHLIDRANSGVTGKLRQRPITYCEALRLRQELLEAATIAFNNLISCQVFAVMCLFCYMVLLMLHTHTTQPFYGSVEFVRENPGEPVPEETFTHYSHRSHQSSLSAFSI